MRQGAKVKGVFSSGDTVSFVIMGEELNKKGFGFGTGNW